MRAISILTLAGALLAAPSPAQDRPGPAAELAAGALFFPDDGGVNEPFVGAAARFYVLPRVSVGPEVAFIKGDNHDHVMLTGNVMFDILRPVQSRPRTVTPFIVAGAGMFRTTERFFDDAFTSAEGAFTAGGGVRGIVGRRLIVGAEARIGWELHIRANGFLGVQLGL